jgi:hypothetical protein
MRRGVRGKKTIREEEGDKWEWMGMESHQEGGARECNRRFWKERGKVEVLTSVNREADTTAG